MSLNFEDLIENLHDAVYFVDKDRTITFWNKSAEHLTGFTSKEVVGSRCRDHILNHVDAKGKNLCKEEHSKNNEKPLEYSLYCWYDNLSHALSFKGIVSTFKKKKEDPERYHCPHKPQPAHQLPCLF